MCRQTSFVRRRPRFDRPPFSLVFCRMVRDLTSGVVLPPGFRVYFNLAAECSTTSRSSPNCSKIALWPGLIDHIGIK